MNCSLLQKEEDYHVEKTLLYSSEEESLTLIKKIEKNGNYLSKVSQLQFSSKESDVDRIIKLDDYSTEVYSKFYPFLMCTPHEEYFQSATIFNVREFSSEKREFPSEKREFPSEKKILLKNRENGNYFTFVDNFIILFVSHDESASDEEILPYEIYEFNKTLLEEKIFSSLLFEENKFYCEDLLGKKIGIFHSKNVYSFQINIDERKVEARLIGSNKKVEMEITLLK